MVCFSTTPAGRPDAEKVKGLVPKLPELVAVTINALVLVALNFRMPLDVTSSCG